MMLPQRAPSLDALVQDTEWRDGQLKRVGVKKTSVVLKQVGGAVGWLLLRGLLLRWACCLLLASA